MNVVFNSLCLPQGEQTTECQQLVLFQRLVLVMSFQLVGTPVPDYWFLCEGFCSPEHTLLWVYDNLNPKCLAIRYWKSPLNGSGKKNSNGTTVSYLISGRNVSIHGRSLQSLDTSAAQSSTVQFVPDKIAGSTISVCATLEVRKYGNWFVFLTCVCEQSCGQMLLHRTLTCLAADKKWGSLGFVRV